MSGRNEKFTSSRRTVLKSAGAGVAAFGAASLIPAPSTARREPAGRVVIVYDDSPVEDYTKSFPVHQEYDVPGCAAVCPGLMDTTDRWLERRQLAEMYDAGWEVMSHTLKHRSLGEIPIHGDIEEGDTEIHMQSNLHGQYEGDPLVIFDGETEVTATSAGRERDGDAPLLLVEEPIEAAFEAGDGYQTWVRYTDEFTHHVLEESRAQIEAWGFGPCTAYVHPYNRYDGYVTDVLPEFYETTPNRRRDPLNPLPEPDPFGLGRANFEDNKMTDDELVEFLDTVANQPYLGILYGHSNFEPFTQDRIAQTFELCAERDIAVVTLQEALAEYGVLDRPSSEPPDTSGSNDSASNTSASTGTNQSSETAGHDEMDQPEDTSVVGTVLQAIREFLRGLIGRVTG